MTADSPEPRDWLEPLLLRRALRESNDLEPLEREALLWLRFVRWVALVSVLGGAIFVALAIKGRMAPTAPAQAGQPAQPAHAAAPKPLPRPPGPAGTIP